MFIEGTTGVTQPTDLFIGYPVQCGKKNKCCKKFKKKGKQQCKKCPKIIA